MSKSDEIYGQVQEASCNLSDKLNTYSNMVDLKRKDFAELTLLLLEYWSLDNDLSAEKASEDISDEIEEKVIWLAKRYGK